MRKTNRQKEEYSHRRRKDFRVEGSRGSKKKEKKIPRFPRKRMLDNTYGHFYKVEGAMLSRIFQESIDALGLLFLLFRNSENSSQQV